MKLYLFQYLTEVQNNYICNIYKFVPKQKYVLRKIYALFNICSALPRQKYTNIWVNICTRLLYDKRG